MTPATTKRTANDSNTLYDKGSIDFNSHSVKSGWGNGKLCNREVCRPIRSGRDPRTESTRDSEKGLGMMAAALPYALKIPVSSTQP